MIGARRLISTFCQAQRQKNASRRVFNESLVKPIRGLSSTPHSSSGQNSKSDSGDYSKQNVVSDDNDFEEGDSKEGDNVLDVQVPPGMEREMVEMWNKDAPHGPEWGGPRGYEPTRYGDWARNGRVSDF